LKRRFLDIALSVSLIVSVAAFFFLADKAFGDELEDLIKERTTTMYLEGQKLGDLILGARARLDFLFVDDSLLRAARTSGMTPDWLKWHLGHFGDPQIRGKDLFVLRYEAYKPWDFDPFKIVVNGKNLTEEDILTKLIRISTGSLSPNTVDSLAFAVPKAKDGVYNITYESDRIEIDVKKIKREN